MPPTEPPSTPTPSAGPPRRKRGAPKGNKNALKHGFYSRRFKKTDIADLDHYEFSGLQDEITMLRVFIRRIIELSYNTPDLEDSVSLLRAMSAATISLTRLIRTQHILFQGRDPALQALDEALEEVIAEMGLDQDHSS